MAVKRAYYAVQNVVSVFDDTVNLVDNPTFTNRDWTVRSQEYRKDDGRPVYAFWTDKQACGEWFRESVMHGGRPNDSFETRPCVFVCKGEPLKDPVWVDLFSGRIYEFPKSCINASKGDVMYFEVPVYDSPCLLTERSVVIDEKHKPTMPFEEMIERAKREASAFDVSPRARMDGALQQDSSQRVKGLEI